MDRAERSAVEAIRTQAEILDLHGEDASDALNELIRTGLASPEDNPDEVAARVRRMTDAAILFHLTRIRNHRQ